MKSRYDAKHVHAGASSARSAGALVRKSAAMCCNTLALFLLLVSAAHAEGRNADDIARSIAIDSSDRFAASADRIRSEMRVGGHYALIPREDRESVEAHLHRIEAVLSRTGPAHAPSPDQALELQLLRKDVAALLAPYDNPRLACDTRPNLGCAFR